MITTSNLEKVLEHLGFVKSTDIYSKSYDNKTTINIDTGIEIHIMSGLRYFNIARDTPQKYNGPNASPRAISPKLT